MATQILQQIANKERSIPSAVKPAIYGNVARISRIHKEITSTGKSREFFYREGRISDTQRTFIQRQFIFYMSVALANKAAGLMLDAEFAEWRQLKEASVSTPVIVSPADLWDKTDTCSSLLSKVNRSWGNFDIPATRESLVRLRATVDTMLRDVNQMPEFSHSNG